MLNVVVLIGRTTKDLELRYTPAGVATCTFLLAVDDPFAKTDQKADFINIVAWKQTAEACAKYLKKGRLCSVEGRIKTRNYENSEGKKVYVTEILANNVRFLESSKTDGGRNEEGSNPSSNRDPFADDGKSIDISDSDLPFKRWMKFRKGWTQEHGGTGDMHAYSRKSLDRRKCA
jgi:single-strand DNA-binding protein